MMVHSCGLCRRHTLPMLTPDGHTNMDFFKFGSDRVSFGTFGSHRVAIGSENWGSGVPSCLSPKSLACQKTCRRSHEVSYSCGVRVSIGTIVWPSCCLREGSCNVRVVFGIIRCFWYPEDNTMETRSSPMVTRTLPKATRRRVAFGIPPGSHRITIRWSPGVDTMVVKTDEFESQAHAVL